MIGKMMNGWCFRGKVDGTWAYGPLVTKEGKKFCVEIDDSRADGTPVEDGTMSVWTGQVDKNGKRIYTGDVVYSISLDEDSEGSEFLGIVGLHEPFSKYIVEDGEGNWQFLDFLPNKEVLGFYMDSEMEVLLDIYKSMGLNLEREKVGA